MLSLKILASSRKVIHDTFILGYSECLIIYSLYLGIILMILGIIGCLVPVLPGPPLSFLGLIFLHLITIRSISHLPYLLLLGIIAVVVTILDYIVPVWGTKRFGGSKYGTRGATVGLDNWLFPGTAGNDYWTTDRSICRRNDIQG